MLQFAVTPRGAWSECIISLLLGFTDRVLYTVFGAELLEECMHGAPRRGAVPDLRVRHLGVSI